MSNDKDKEPELKKDNLQIIYDNLVKNNVDLPNYITFVSNLGDSSKAQKFHQFLRGENYDVPEDYNRFASTLNIGNSLKKKDDTVAPSSPGSETSFDGSGSEISAAESIPANSGSDNLPDDGLSLASSSIFTQKPISSDATQVNREIRLTQEEQNVLDEQNKSQYQKDIDNIQTHVMSKYENILNDKITELQGTTNNQAEFESKSQKIVSEVQEEATKEAVETFEKYIEINKEKIGQQGPGYIEALVSNFVQPLYKLPGQALQFLGAVTTFGDVENDKIFRQMGVSKEVGYKGFYDMGEDYVKAIEELAPTNPKFAEDLSQQFSNGFGQVASMILTAGISGMTAKTASIGSNMIGKSALKESAKSFAKTLTQPTAIVGGIQMSVPEFEQALESGATPAERMEVLAANFIGGSVLEQAPMLQFLKRIDKATAGSLGDFIVKKGAAAFKGGFEEGFTEFLQGIYSNATAKEVYDSTREILDGVYQEGYLGFGIGFALNAIGANIRMAKKQLGESPEIEKAEALIEEKKNEFETKPIQDENQKEEPGVNREEVQQEKVLKSEIASDEELMRTKDRLESKIVRTPREQKLLDKINKKFDRKNQASSPDPEIEPDQVEPGEKSTTETRPDNQQSESKGRPDTMVEPVQEAEPSTRKTGTGPDQTVDEANNQSNEKLIESSKSGKPKGYNESSEEVQRLYDDADTTSLRSKISEGQKIPAHWDRESMQQASMILEDGKYNFYVGKRKKPSASFDTFEEAILYSSKEQARYKGLPVIKTDQTVTESSENVTETDQTVGKYEIIQYSKENPGVYRESVAPNMMVYISPEQDIEVEYNKKTGESTLTVKKKNGQEDFYIEEQVPNRYKRKFEDGLSKLKQANDAIIAENSKLNSNLETPSGTQSEKNVQIGITPATDKLPDIKEKMDQATELNRQGKSEEASKVYNEILDQGETELKNQFDAEKIANYTINRTSGNFFRYNEPTFNVSVPIKGDEDLQKVVRSVSRFAEKFKQDNVHISKRTRSIPKGIEFGVDLGDGFVYEPEHDFRFDNKIDDKTIKQLEDDFEEIGLAGFTFHPDRKGINLYNISKFSDANEFINKTKKLEEVLNNRGISSESIAGFRRILNLGNPDYGATRGYEGGLRSENLESQPEKVEKPPSEPVKSSSEPPLSGKERTIAKRYIKDPDVSEEVKKGLSEEGRNYIPTTDKLRTSEADAIIEELGTDDAISYIKDTSNGLRDDLRAFVGKRLYTNLKEQIRNETDNQSKTKLRNALNDLIETTAKLGTKAGQTVQAFSHMFASDPEAVAYALAKQVNQVKNQALESRQGEITNLKDLIRQADEQAIKDILNDPRVKKIISESKSKQSNRKKFTNKVLDFLDKLESEIDDNANKAFDATYKLGASLYKTAINVVRTAIKAGDSLADAVEKAIAHIKSKHESEWDEPGFRKIFDKQIKAEVASDKRTIMEVLENQGTDLTEIALSHYTEYSKAKKTLAEKLIDQGIDENEANRIGKAFDSLIEQKRKQILEKRFISKKSLTSSRKKQKQLVEKIIEATNLGAMSDAEIRNLYAEKMGIPTITDQQAQEIQDMVDKAEVAPEGFQKYEAVQDIINYHQKIQGIPWYKVMESVWYANILSGLSTQSLNFQANSVQAIAEMYVSAIQGAIEKPRLAVTHMVQLLKGAIEGVKEAAPTSLSILQKGYQPLKDFKFDKDSSVKGISGQRSDVLEIIQKEGDTTYKRLANKFFSNWKYVSRLMMATDMLFYGLSRGARKNQLAFREALKNNKDATSEQLIKEANRILGKDDATLKVAKEQAELEGLTGRDFNRRVAEIIDQQLDQDMVEDVNDFAARATFNYDPEGVLGVLTGILSNLTSKVPLGKLVVPFTRIISNVANQYLDWTPWGLVRVAKGGIGLDLAALESYKKYTPEQKQRVAIKAITGTVAMATLYALSMEGEDGEDPFLEITADGANDLFKNYELQATGWKPYTFKVNIPGLKDLRLEYRNTPLGIPFAMIGYARDLEKYKSGKFTENMFGALFSGYFQYMSDLSFLSSLQDFFEIISQNRYGSTDISGKITNYMTRAGKGVIVPNLYTQLSRTVQEITNSPIKKANNFYENLVRDVPYFRDSLGNIYNSLGDPVVPEQAYKFNPVITRFSVDGDPVSDTDKVWQLIVDTKSWIGAPSKSTKVYDPKLDQLREFDEDEYHEYARIAGQLTKQLILENYNSIITNGDKETIKNIISGLKSTARTTAKTKVKLK